MTTEAIRTEERPTKRLKNPPLNERETDACLAIVAKEDADEKSKEREPPLAAENTEQDFKKKHEPKSAPNSETSQVEGFIIKCQNDECLLLSAEEATTLKERCEFFRNAFRHGTKEGQSGVLFKPDWTKETADHLIDIIMEGKCEIPQDYSSLQEAAQQVLLRLRVRHPLCNGDISHDTELVQSLFKRWAQRKSHFVLETPLLNSRKKWQDLFDHGVVIIRDEKDLIVERNNQKATPENRPVSTDATTFIVASSTPLCVSLFHTCFYLCGSHASASRLYGGTNQIFQLFFRTNFGAGTFLRHAIGPTIKVIHTKSGEVVKCNGSVEELCKVLDAVKDFVIPPGVFMLMVTNPNSWTLGRFIRAAQHCDHKPATLGWKSENNSFYALKNINDTRGILSFLADPDSGAATSGHFHIRDHSLNTDWKAF